MLEKEYNGMLIDHLASLERLEEIAAEANETNVLKAIQREKEVINRKLYQQPPLITGKEI